MRLFKSTIFYKIIKIFQSCNFLYNLYFLETEPRWSIPVNPSQNDSLGTSLLDSSKHGVFVVYSVSTRNERHKRHVEVNICLMNRSLSDNLSPVPRPETSERMVKQVTTESSHWSNYTWSRGNRHFVRP